jgi:hypothetical protein
MNIPEIYTRLIDIGEQADNLCRQLPRHRFEMHLRDLSTQVSNAAAALSDETREVIARN